MRQIFVYTLIGWSNILLCIDGARSARNEQIAAPQGEATALRQFSAHKEQAETTALRRKGRVVPFETHLSAENDVRMDTRSAAKVSLSQDPYIPVYSPNAMTTTVPGYRPRALVVVGMLVACMVALLAAISASIHRKVSEDMAAASNPPAFGALLGHSLSPVPIALSVHRTADFARAIQALQAESPGDLRRVEDEIAELTKDLTPPSSPESSQPEPAVEPEPETTVSPEKSIETTVLPEKSDLSPFTPSTAISSDCTTDPATPPTNEAAGVSPSHVRSLDDEFAGLTQDLFPESSSAAAAAPADSTPCVWQGIPSHDFAEVKTLRAVCTGELRSHVDEFSALVQDLMPSTSSALTPHVCPGFSAQDFAEVKTLGAACASELRSHNDEFSELTQDLLPSTSSDATPHIGFSAQDFADVRTLRGEFASELRSHHDEFSDLIQDLLP